MNSKILLFLAIFPVGGNLCFGGLMEPFDLSLSFFSLDQANLPPVPAVPIPQTMPRGPMGRINLSKLPNAPDSYYVSRINRSRVTIRILPTIEVQPRVQAAP